MHKKKTLVVGMKHSSAINSISSAHEQKFFQTHRYLTRDGLKETIRIVRLARNYLCTNEWIEIAELYSKEEYLEISGFLYDSDQLLAYFIYFLKQVYQGKDVESLYEYFSKNIDVISLIEVLEDAFDCYIISLESEINKDNRIRLELEIKQAQNCFNELKQFVNTNPKIQNYA